MHYKKNEIRDIEDKHNTHNDKRNTVYSAQLHCVRYNVYRVRNGVYIFGPENPQIKARSRLFVTTAFGLGRADISFWIQAVASR